MFSSCAKTSQQEIEKTPKNKKATELVEIRNKKFKKHFATYPSNII